MYEPCFKCKKVKTRREHHHITYEPPQVVTLCQNPCHNKITELNTLVAQCLNRAITNEERHYLWNMFLNSPLYTMWYRKGKKSLRKKLKIKRLSAHKAVDDLYGLIGKV